MTSTATDQRQFLLSKRRRAAAQRVRDARDRLTSTTGTRPVFDYELLRLFAQNRISASLVILLLVGMVGLLSSLGPAPSPPASGPSAFC
jgi:two-component system, cell cycle sensor histidine kinase PleC